MSAQWKDVSGKDFKAWEIRLGKWRLTVVYNHRDYPGQYIYYVPGLYVPKITGNILLPIATTEEEAKCQALGALRDISAQLMAEIDEVLQ